MVAELLHEHVELGWSLSQVRETFNFAARCQGAGLKGGEPPWQMQLANCWLSLQIACLLEHWSGEVACLLWVCEQLLGHTAHRAVACSCTSLSVKTCRRKTLARAASAA